MTIDALPPVGSVAALSGSTELGSQAATAEQPSSFFSLIGDKLNSIDGSIKHSESLVEAYIKGESVPVHEIMIALGKAKTEIQLAVEIRNKVLESYQEITKIQL